jgi:hypothetical protein
LTSHTVPLRMINNVTVPAHSSARRWHNASCKLMFLHAGVFVSRSKPNEKNYLFLYP